MNWYILIPFAVVIVALLIWLVVRNLKDEKDFEKQQNMDYKKTKDEEDDELGDD